MSKSKLELIVEQRVQDVAESKIVTSLSSLISRSFSLSSELGPPADLSERLTGHEFPPLFVAAEFKRASPSKGDIALDLAVDDQTLMYAEAGTGMISVLTEPKWFKGSLEDLEISRRVTNSMNPRPLILRKDFIFDEYQLHEARAYGADTVLLMKSILEEPLLDLLIKASRALCMEPLVEVVNEEETLAALRCGAKVLGVNNRNLHTFVVDMKTTTAIVDVLLRENAPHVKLLALSGVKSREDVIPYEECHGMVTGILVGEALMRSTNPRAFLRSLVYNDQIASDVTRVKVCGINTVEAAQAAAQAGADMIGLIFVAKSVRSVNVEQAKTIIKSIYQFREREGNVKIECPTREETWFDGWAKKVGRLCDGQARPLVVGVFMNQPIDEVNRIAQETGIDLIQLHGHETANDEAKCILPVIRVIHVDSQSSELVSPSDLSAGPASMLLLDTSVKGGGTGGTGVTFDWAIAKDVRSKAPVIMAGGLVPENVAQAIIEARPWGVDVASGVESAPGVKDLEKIRAFVKAAKA